MIQLSNDVLTLTYRSEDGQISIRDAKRDITWQLDAATRCYWHAGQQHALPQSTHAEALTDVALRERFDVLGKPLTYTWQLLDDGVEVTLSFEHIEGELESVALPGSFMPENKALTLAMPIMQGVLYDGRGEPFARSLHQGGHEGFSMSMAGYLTDVGGLLLSVEDYAEWRAQFGKRDNGAIYVYARGAASLGALRYPRRVRLLLTDAGITALCKRYRARVQERGDWKSWEAKIAEKPSLERLFGGLMTFIGYNASDLDYVAACQKLRDYGFERAFIYPVRFNHYSQQFLMGGDKPIRLSDDVVAAIKDLGFDVSAWNWVYEGLDDGSEFLQRSFQLDTQGNRVPHWKMDEFQWYVCSLPGQIDYMKRAYAGGEKPMTWAHYDVIATMALPESFHLDPSWNLGETLDRRANLKLLRELLGPQTNGDRAVSSEGFNDMLSTAYDIGSTKLLPAFGEANFWTVPMTMLVYHDSLIHDWWEVHNYNFHAGFDHKLAVGHKVDGFPHDKAAMDALYGSPPNVFPFGRQYQWVNIEKRITRSYSVAFEDEAVQEALAAALPVTHLHKRIGKLELISHEFISADGAVQATVFADGTRVVANFGDAPFVVNGVGEIGAKCWVASGGTDDVPSK